MASDFERFLGELSATMGIPSAPAPVTRTPSPVATPTPAPSQSPFANASPQQQQMIQQASAGLPPDLVAQIASLAASTAQQAPQVRQQPQMPQPQAQPQIDPNAMASTSMVGMGPMQTTQAPAESPLAAKEGEGYVMVNYDSGTDAGMVLVAVPERYKDDLPEGVELYGDGQVIPGQAKDSIAANGQLLEQQPEEIQNALVSPKKVRDEQYPAQAEADAPREQSTQEPLMRVQDAEGRVHLVPDSDELPEGMTLIHRAGEEMPDTRLQGVSSPRVTGEMTPQQQQDMYNQNVVEVDAEGNPVEDELVVITVDEIRAIGDPEADVFADQLEQSGLTEYRSDMYYIQDAETGRITAITEEEYEQQYPEAGPLEPMTTNLIRDKYGMNAEANELEAQGIFIIPDGQMAVKRNGRWVLVMASETPPSDAENVVYGGESRPLDDKSILGGVDDLASVPGSLFRGGLDILGLFDKPRQFNVETQGERAYEDVVNNRDEYIANAEKNRADRESGGIIGGIRRAEDWVEQNQIDPYKDFENWVKAEPEAVIDAYENGYTDPETGQKFTGGRAVWEKYASTQPWITRSSGEIIMDPLTALGVGGGVSRSVGSSLMRGNVPQRLAGRFLDKTGRAMQLPDTVIDTMVARGASKTWNTLTTPTVRATIQKNLADDVASLTGIPAARWIARKFEHTPEAQVAIQTGDVNRAQSTLIDQQPIYREGDMPTSASGDTPSPSSPSDPTAPAPRDPSSPTPSDGAPSGMPTGTSSSVDTPPIPRDVIDTLPPAQRALYDNWDQQPLDLAGESPFAYREDGSVGTDWDFAGPRTDDEGRKIAALLDDDDYARRIIDETFISYEKSMPDRWKYFVDTHDPKAQRFIQRERYIQGRSVDSKALRNDFDYAQKQLSQVNEARYIVDDLIPDFRAAFPDEAIPEYRYKNTAKDARLTTAERDDVLIEAAVFGNEQQARDARNALGNKAFNNSDEHLIALMPEIDSLRSRYLDRLDGRMPDPRPAPTPGNISTDPIPEQQAPRPGEPTPAPEPTGAGLPTDAAPSSSAPRRQGLGIAPQDAVEANAVKRRDAQKWFRPAMRKAGIKDEWISAYARRQGLDSSADLPVEEMQRLVRLARSDAKAVRDLLESSFDAQAPRGVSGIEQMSPSDIRTTWGMKKSDLKKNLGIDRSLQPRAKPFDEEHVRGIVDNYVGERMDPIIVKRASDGETYVVAGHNRLEAAKRLNVDVPVRYTDAVGEDLLRLSRETNMQNLGMSMTNISQSVRQMVEEGRSFEEIGRALKLSPDGSARTPATMAERYYNFSFLREGSNLHRLTDQGILPMEVSANAGRGIRNGNLTQAEVESLAFRVSDNRLNPKYFDGIIKRAIRRAEEGKSSQMGGLFEGMGVTDNLKAAEDEFMGLWDTWRKTHDEWRPLNEKKLDGTLTREERTRLAQLEADKVRLGDELDIPENKLYMREPTAEGFLNRDYDVDGSMAPARDEVPTAGAADNVAPAPDAAPSQVDNAAPPRVESTSTPAEPQTHPRVEEAVAEAQANIRKGMTPENVRAKFRESMNRAERAATREMDGDVYAYIDDANLRVAEALDQVDRSRAVSNDIIKIIDGVYDPWSHQSVLRAGNDDDILSLVREIREGMMSDLPLGETRLPTYDRLRSKFSADNPGAPAGMESPYQLAEFKKAGVRREEALEGYLKMVRDSEGGQNLTRTLDRFKRARGSRAGIEIRPAAANEAMPTPEAPATRPEFDNSGPIVDDAPRLDDDGNPIRSMADNPDAQPLFSARQTASPGWQPAPVNHSRNQPTAAVMAYSSPLGQWEFPNLNLGKLRDRINRWAGDPVGDRNATSEFLPNTGTTTDRATRTPGTEYWGDATRAPEPEVKTIRGRVVDEGSYDHHLLTQTFDDGEQIIQRWERLANEYEGRGLTAQQAEVRAGDQVMADWGEQAIKNYDAKNGTEFHAKYVREYERLTTTGKVADRPTGTMAQMKAASRAMGDGNRVVSFYDEALGVLREMTLYNALTGPRYIMTQLVGNTITAMITGNWGTIGRAFREYKASYQQMSGESDNWVMKMLGGVDDGELTEATLRRGIRELEGQPKMVLYDTTDRHMMEWGVAGTRDDIVNVVRDEITDVGANTRFSRLRLGSMNIDKMTKGVFASKSIRDMANAFDLSFRKAMYGHQLKINNGGARIALRNRMMDTMPSSLPTSQFDELWDELPEVFGAHRIRETFGSVDAKWADRMARDWQSAIRKMDLDARDKTYKLFFTGHERNADKVLRRVVFFHYWMSRATPLYTEALMRNPAMLRAYTRMLEEIKEQEESGKFGSAVNGFWEFMSTPFGYNIFIRPDAFLQTVFALDQGSDFTPEGETMLGALMRKTPLMINPLIDSAANLLGIKGDTFAPDPLMLGQWSNLVTNGSNFLESRFGLGDGQPNKNLYSEFWTNKVRTHTSGHLGLPKLDAVDSTQYARRDINYFIMEVAEEQGLDPVGVEAMAAMDDPDSPLYKAGYSRYSNMKLVEHGLRFLPVTSPFYPKVRQERGDETRYTINTAEPGTDEREDAFIQRAIAQTSDPQARTLAMQQREYTRLGPEDAREAYGIYNSILYGGLSEPVTIDGVAVNDWMLMGMSKDDRQKAADAWAEQSGNTENVETIRALRKEYRDAHPEYNDYMQWRFQISDYEGGAIKYWSDLAEGNANAERYLSGIEDADPDMIEMELTSVTAYMQYKGIRPTIYDPDPISTNSGTAQPYNPAGTSGGSRTGYGTGPSTTIEEDIAKYESDMAEFTAKYGNLQNMTPPMRTATMNNARTNGDSVPQLSGKAQAYLEWAAAQPPGSDTSIAAYERWKGVEDASEEEQGLVGSNQQADSGGINELLSILQL